MAWRRVREANAENTQQPIKNRNDEGSGTADTELKVTDCNAVLWLASPAASFVTATDLEVDGRLGAFGAFADPYAPE